MAAHRRLGRPPPDTLLEGPDGKCTRGMHESVGRSVHSLSPSPPRPSDMSAMSAAQKPNLRIIAKRLFERPLLRRKRTTRGGKHRFSNHATYAHSHGAGEFPPDANMSIIHPFSALWQRRGREERERRLRRPPTMKMVIAPSPLPLSLSSLSKQQHPNRAVGRSDGRRLRRRPRPLL